MISKITFVQALKHLESGFMVPQIPGGAMPVNNLAPPVK
jgi:hypothetical protein